MSSVPLEIERKLLIDAPDAEALAAAATSVSEIVQTYLVPDGWDAERVRHRLVRDADGTRTQLTHTCKRSVAAGVAEELEEEIDDAGYADLLRRTDPARVPIHKTRWVVPWDGLLLEIDSFHSPRTLWLLEVELSSADDLLMTLALPPWITGLREVTGDPAYSNVALALPDASSDGPG